MEWLRKLLEGAKVTDGKVDIEALMTSINTEFPKNAVPKDKYNDVSARLKTANTTIEDLKKNNKDNEELQKKIKEHEATIATQTKEYESKVKNLTLDNAINNLLTTNKAKYVDLLASKFDREKLTIKEDGTVEGLDVQFKEMKESYKDMFEDTEGSDPTYKYTPKGGGKEQTKSFNMVDIVRENQSRR